MFYMWDAQQLGVYFFGNEQPIKVSLENTRGQQPMLNWHVDLFHYVFHSLCITLNRIHAPAQSLAGTAEWNQ
ncbi:hypothetical protein SAMN04488689_105374 [Paenibacillus sp. cl6col]|nr:hypothetical protein SAMN04488689_105374 [Paenibacillus sp. cl6col]